MEKNTKQYDIYAQAFSYAVKGHSVIPVGKDKRPLLRSWKQYQTEAATEEQITEWFTETYKDANVGIVTGAVSGITVVDVDVYKKPFTHPKEFPPTFTVKTGNGGFQLYYKYHPGLTISANGYPNLPAVDIRSDGGYVVAPPSVTSYPNKDGKMIGGEYTIYKNLPLADFPIHMFPETKPKKKISAVIGAAEGSRNDNIASVTGTLLHAERDDKKWETEVWPAVQRINQTFSPPLGEHELRTTFESIMNKERQRKSEMIVSPIQFNDPNGVPAGEVKVSLRKNGNGVPYKDMANVLAVLAAHPYYKGTIKYNEFRQEIEYNGKPLEEGDIIKIQVFMQVEGLLPGISKDAVYSAITHYANQNKYDEAQDWIKSLTWDGTPRLKNWLSKATKVTDDEYHQGIGSQWFMGLVRRIMEPGCQFDYMLVFVGKQGIGKAEWVENIIPTPTGQKRFGDLKPGDFVFGKDGSPNRVLQTFPQGVRQLYKVIMNDNSFVYVDGDHLWEVYDRTNIVYKGKGKTLKGNNKSIFVRTPKKQILTTKQIIENGLYIKNGGCPFFRYELPSNNAVEGNIYRSNKDAYALGCWLGDGTINEGSITCNSKDVWDKLRLLGWDFKDYPKNSSQSVTLYGFKEIIKELGLLNKYSYDKFIPEECFNWNIEARKELLSGLLDTDGNCTGGSKIGYCSTSKKLASDVTRLARSLGGKATEPLVKKTTHRDAYRISVLIDWNPFTVVEKKKERWSAPTNNDKRTIKEIILSHQGEAMCIKVESEDELYLTKDYIVTHNTSLFRIIGGPWYKSYTGQIDNKDFYLALRGAAIVDLDEGAAMYKSEAIKIKSVITETHDEFRAPYDRVMKKNPRRFVFSMSTNDTEPFRDVTGNRRYWTLDGHEKVDFVWLQENRDQLFAETYHYWKEKTPIAEVPLDQAVANQERHLPDDSWTDIVVNEVRRSKDYCEGNPKFSTTITQVFSNVFPDENLARLGKGQEMRLANIFKKQLGLEKKQEMHEGERRVVWRISDEKIAELKKQNAKNTDPMQPFIEAGLVKDEM
jgi:predicted P-loop ATPase